MHLQNSLGVRVAEIEERSKQGKPISTLVHAVGGLSYALLDTNTNEHLLCTSI